MIHDTCCRCVCCCCCCCWWWWWWWWWWWHTSISWKFIRWSLQHLNALQISFNQSLDQTISIGRRELLPTYGTMDANGHPWTWRPTSALKASLNRKDMDTYCETFWRKWCLNNVMLILLHLQNKVVRLVSGMWLYLYTSDGHLLHEVAIWWNTTQTAATWGYASIADFHCISMHYHLETPKSRAKTLCKLHAVAPCQDSTHLPQHGYHQDLDMSCLECAIWELFREQFPGQRKHSGCMGIKTIL